MPDLGEGIKIVAKNSKAYHDYFIEEKYEAGIELAGTEVKSIRQGHVNLKDSFCLIKDGQMSVIGMHISPYEKGQHLQQGPPALRRLLMHKREILQLLRQDQAGRLLPDPPVHLLPWAKGQAGAGAGQRQEAL
ncbi:MAG: SsrA-binding protein [Lawsonibacter sp.]